MKKRVFIAGGAGFIGSHLVDCYLSRGYQVTAMDNLSSGKALNLAHQYDNPDFSFIEDDILTSSDLPKFIKNSDLIFNMAAVVGVFNVISQPLETLKINISILERILNIIDSLTKKPIVITASTAEVYGSNENPMKESDPLVIASTQKNHASYPVSKLYNEINAIAYYKEKGVPVIVVRIFNTTGPRQRGRYGMVVPRFVKQALTQEPITIFGDGQQTRSFCLVNHTCEQLFRISESPDSIGKIINVGNSKSITIEALAQMVKSMTNSRSEIVYLSEEHVYKNENLYIKNRSPDLTLVESLTKMRCHWSIEEIISAAIIAREEKMAFISGINDDA